MAIVRSEWASRPVIPGGVLTAAEWSDAGRIPMPAGYLMVKNNADYLYVAFDLVGDRGNDAGTGDYFWFSVDIDGNRAITPRRDTNYGLWPGEPHHLARQYYLGPGVWTGILNESSSSLVRMGFGPSPNSATPHRVWEMRLSLEELGVDLSVPGPPPVVRFGVRVSSTSPRFTFDYPANFYTDFSGLHQIVLARHPRPIFPPGTPGILIGGVGLIPATQIDQVTGLATTDPSYYHHVQDAAFGSRLNLIGNRTTLQQLWANGARRYRVLHRFNRSGVFRPVSASWTNYRWNGTRYVLEHFGPDADQRYPLQNPTADFSIDDLLLQWQSVGAPAGIHEFRASSFVNAAGAAVAAPNQTLAITVDNNLPHVDLVDILHNGASVPACAIVRMRDAADGLRFRITANDPEAHLRAWSLRGHWGDGAAATIASDHYGAHVGDAPPWTGVSNQIVPAGEWIPPVSCAYQFRVNATARVTNGYSWVGYTYDTRHVTVIKRAAISALEPAVTTALPFGLVAFDTVADEGKEPERLGDETFRRKKRAAAKKKAAAKKPAAKKPARKKAAAKKRTARKKAKT